jgi:CDGSH-type Zn-finger protein
MEEDKENKFGADVEVTDWGPLKITGDFRIKDLKRDTEDSPAEILLCLCGKSGIKPLCDESCKK